MVRQPNDVFSLTNDSNQAKNQRSEMRSSDTGCQVPESQSTKTNISAEGELTFGINWCHCQVYLPIRTVLSAMISSDLKL